MQAGLFDDDDPFRHLPKKYERENPAFDGLTEQTKEVLCDESVTPAMVRDLVSVLSSEPRLVVHVVAALRSRPWFKTEWKLPTATRFVRRIQEAALAKGHPVCSSNEGLRLGTAADMRAMAARESAQARGAFEKARLCERVAEQMEQR